MNLSVPAILLGWRDMTLISMSAKELDRYRLIEDMGAGRMTTAEVAEKSCVTERTVYRWRNAVGKRGVKGLVHGNRGRPSTRRIPDAEAERIIRIVRKTYLDCTAQLIAEKLAEEHDIERDPKTIARVLREAKAWESPMAHAVRRARPQHRSWRERRSHRGELVQFDGSYHHWLEDRGGTDELCLLAGIDDAGSEVLHAEFAAHEGVLPVMGFWLGYAGEHGLPKSIYVDKFSTYRMHIETARENPDTRTQLQRAMKTVGVEVIFANSSQAKGRIERLFRTFQDRLVKELRFKNISTVEEANRFLKEKFIPAFNRRFAIQPKKEQDFHRPQGAKDLSGLKDVFVRREERTVQHDFTVAFQTQWYQILPTTRLAIRPKDRVEVREYPDSSLGFFIRNKPVEVRAIPKRVPAAARKIAATLVPSLLN